MKTYVLKIKFILLAVILYISAMLIESGFNDSENYQIDTERFKKTLHKKELVLDTIINHFFQNLEKKLFLQFPNSNNLLLQSNLNKLSKDGYAVVVFVNDSLKFWSDNSMQIPETYTGSMLNNRIVNLNNAWYVTKYKKLGRNDYIVGFIKIKSKYSYQNKFLKNEFHPDFNLRSTIQISMIPLSYSFDIQDKDSNYIFSLVPTNIVVSETNYVGLTGILYLLSLTFLFLFLYSIFNRLIENNTKKWIFLGIAIVLFVRYITIRLKIPFNIYAHPFFESQYYATSVLFPSLGDLYLNTLSMMLMIWFVIKTLPWSKIKTSLSNSKSKLQYVFFTAFIILLLLFFAVIAYLFHSLIINSKIPFETYKILSLNLFSLIGYLIIIFLIGTFLACFNYITNQLTGEVSTKKFWMLYLIILLPISIISLFVNILPDAFALGFFLAVIPIIFFINHYGAKNRYYFYVLICFIATIYITGSLVSAINLKQNNDSKAIVSKLANERDAVAELLLTDIASQIEKDGTIMSYIQKPSDMKTAEKIRKHLQKKYFHGFWNKYDIEVTICSNDKNMSDENSLNSCSDYFSALINKNGKKLENSNFNFINNQNGTVSYLGIHQFFTDEQIVVRLYIKLDSRLISKELGYPELLLDDKIKTSTILDYSYAKYQNHELLIKSGTYPYDLNDKIFLKSDNEFGYIEINRFKHLVHRLDKYNTIIISWKLTSSLDILISFAYIFVFINVLLLLYLVIFNTHIVVKSFQFDFRNKLSLSMIAILIVSFILVGTGTVYYNINQYTRKHNQNIKEKLQSVLLELEQYLGYEKKLNHNWQNSEFANLDELLRRISQVFFTDLNIFDADGNLIATSRSEIFARGLIGIRINPIAYQKMVIHQKAEYIHKEQIGNMFYQSAYCPFKNFDGQFLAYINLPYFTQPTALQEEISDLLIAVINLYVVLFIIAIIIGVIFSEQITQPLRLLKNRFKNIELGTKHEKITYKGDDEIGDLVKEYNRMVEKLEESIELLSKSERESAWREMAKQIAHEIKNPLTPMKLSIQFLIRSWDNKDAQFDDKLQKVTQTLIEQIDTLSTIATEFSSFAKMPKASDETIDLIEKIENIIQLFDNTTDIFINFRYDGNEKIYVIADKEQLSRVFINLIKNAIQAIPAGIKGVINIVLKKEKENIILTIEDNGSGIPVELRSRMFTPSFTTKSSGMGLGLAIVKNIINSANGNIWFESEVGKGTKFFIEFPVVNQKSKTSE